MQLPIDPLRISKRNFLFYIYDRNPNLNLHTRIYFGDPGDRTHALIERWDSLGRGITTGPNAQVTIAD